MTTQTVKSHIFVQPLARAAWGHYMDSTRRNMLTELSVQDIPDGSERTDLLDLESERIWPDEAGVNILGTPLATNMFVSLYLQGKDLKHRLILHFI